MRRVVHALASHFEAVAGVRVHGLPEVGMGRAEQLGRLEHHLDDVLVAVGSGGQPRVAV